jgi:hypothetical protein
MAKPIRNTQQNPINLLLIGFFVICLIFFRTQEILGMKEKVTTQKGQQIKKEVKEILRTLKF